MRFVLGFRFLTLLYILLNLFCLIIVIQWGVVWSGVFGLNGFVWPLFFLLNGWTVKNDLRSKGYEWATYGRGIQVFLNLYSYSLSVPHRDEFAGVPGYRDDADGLVSAMRESLAARTRV